MFCIGDDDGDGDDASERTMKNRTSITGEEWWRCREVVMCVLNEGARVIGLSTSGVVVRSVELGSAGGWREEGGVLMSGGEARAYSRRHERLVCGVGVR